jgi:hypothetical protein
MKLSQHVTCAIDDATNGKPDAALLHACIAIDATAKRLYPTQGVRRRFVECVRDYYWIVEPMLGAGVNLVETRFKNVSLTKNQNPDLAEIIYEIFRCPRAHGEEIPTEFHVVPSSENRARWIIAKGEVHPPDTLIWALLAIAVFSKVNRAERTTGTYFICLEGRDYPIKDWWGREDDFREFAEKHNQIRVKLDGLEGIGQS